MSRIKHALLPIPAWALLLSGWNLQAEPLFSPVEVEMPLVGGGRLEQIETGSGAWLRAAAHGNGTYVVTGNGGTILYSSDLRAWTPTDSGVEADLSGVAFGHGRFAAVGDDALLLSEDGITWEPQPLHGRDSLRTVIFADDRFLALAQADYLLLSGDGINWTEHPLPFTRDFRQIAHGDGKYIASGLFQGIYTSTDGLTWAHVSSPAPAWGLAHGGGRWVRSTGSFTGSLEYSDDGETWIATKATPGRRPAPAYRNGLFIAFSVYDRYVWVSGDGEQWVRRLDQRPERPIGSADTTLFSMNGRFVAPHENGRMFLFEGDRPARFVAMTDFGLHTYALDSFGRIFTDRNSVWEKLSGEIFLDPQAFTVVDDNTVVMAGSNGRLAVFDGGELRHTRLPTHQYPDLPDDVPDGDLPEPRVYRFLSGIAHDGEGRAVVVGADGLILYSDDLVDWERAQLNREIPVKRTLRAVAHGNGRFVAAGYDGTILFSDDGADWEVSTEQLGDTLGGLDFGRGRFIIAGNGGVILTSENGERWLRRDLGLPYVLSSVSASAHGYLAGDREGRVFRSRDGNDWETIDLGTTLPVTAVGGTHAGLDDGTLLRIDLPPAFPAPLEGEDFFSRLAEPGDDLHLTFPEAVSREPVTYQWLKDGVPIPGATSLTLTLTNLTRADAGSYRLVADTGSIRPMAAGAAGTTTSDPITVALPIDYETWLVEKSPLGEAELADPVLSAPLAAPLGDGITNLARYAFALAAAGDTGGFPRLGFETVTGYGFTEHFPTLTFTRPTGTADLVFQFEESPDLHSWTLLPGWEELRGEVTGETERVTIRANSDLLKNPDADGAFLRARIFWND